MEGSSRVFGVGRKVWFNGRECDVKPRDMEFYALVESEILQRRGDPYVGLVESASKVRLQNGSVDEPALRILVSAFATSFRSYREATHDDVSRWLSSPAGEAFTIWYCLKDGFADVGDSKFTPKLVNFLLQESFSRAVNSGDAGPIRAWSKWKNGLFAAIDAASGDDFLGNLIGLHLLNQEMEAAGQSDESSDTSSTSTDTDSTKSSDSPDTKST